MKKNLTLLALIVTLLSSCSKSDPSPKANIIGEWQIQSIDFQTQYVDEEEDMFTDDYSSLGGTIVFNSDGTYTNTIIDNQEESDLILPLGTGTYKITENKLILNYTDEGIKTSVFYNVKIENDALSLLMDKALFEETLRADLEADPESLALFELTADEIVALFLEDIIKFNISINFQKSKS